MTDPNMVDRYLVAMSETIRPLLQAAIDEAFHDGVSHGLSEQLYRAQEEIDDGQ